MDGYLLRLRRERDDRSMKEHEPVVRKVVCPLCEGHRLMGGTCGECKGTGYVEDVQEQQVEEEKIELIIRRAGNR